MKNQHLPQPNLNIEELKLIEQLRAHSQLRERLPGILRMADDIEALLIEAMRRVGHATMESWARPDGLLAFFTKWSGVEQKGGISRDLLVTNVPQGHKVTRVREKMSEIASSDEASTPVLGWEREEQKLHITDPFFAFFLKWAMGEAQQGVLRDDGSAKVARDVKG